MYMYFTIGLQIKSMAEHLAKIDSLCAPRQMRFPCQFIDDVRSLVQSLIRDIVDRYVRVRYTFVIFVIRETVDRYNLSNVTVLNKKSILQILCILSLPIPVGYEYHKLRSFLFDKKVQMFQILSWSHILHNVLLFQSRQFEYYMNTHAGHGVNIWWIKRYDID